MAMKYSRIKSLDIESYIKTQEFKNIHINVASELQIKGINCEINLCSETINKEGHIISNTLGQTNIKDEFTRVEGISLFKDNIVQNVNDSYSRIPESNKYVLDHILKIFFNFIVIHELTHISQFKEEGSKELKCLVKLKHNLEEYRNSSLEKEANMNAYSYLKEIDEFTATIALDCKKQFGGRNIIDYTDTAELHSMKIINLYHEVYGNNR
ncbi:hypothetical protein ACDX78_19195 [Virgibacillus oceani]